LRNYHTEAVDQDDFSCRIWEAASATVAAPIFFEPVTIKPSGVEFVDGGLRRNNPINEIGRECHDIKAWKDKRIGCLVSLGTGWTDPAEVPARLDKFLKRCLDLTTNSDDIANQFAKSPLGKELSEASAYYRFSVQQGMSALQLDDWKHNELMDGLTNVYLSNPLTVPIVQGCVRALLQPDSHSQSSWANEKILSDRQHAAV
jgi:hypothetical protein